MHGQIVERVSLSEMAFTVSHLTGIPTTTRPIGAAIHALHLSQDRTVMQETVAGVYLPRQQGLLRRNEAIIVVDRVIDAYRQRGLQFRLRGSVARLIQSF
jgi:hypothetical protein